MSLQVTALEVAGVAAERIETTLDFAVLEPPAPDQLAVQVSGTGRAERLRLPEAVPLPPQDLTWRLDLTAPRDGPVTLRELALSAPAAELEVTGELDPQTLAGQAEIGLRVSALAPLTEPFGQRVEGEVSLSADLPSRRGGRADRGRSERPARRIWPACRRARPSCSAPRRSSRRSPC